MIYFISYTVITFQIYTDLNSFFFFVIFEQQAFDWTHPFAFFIFHHRYLFEANGQECNNLCNQWLEWETTVLQVNSS